jgi:MFS family permease
VAFAFLVVMMFATLPSPLYGLYRIRDHLSAFTIVVVFAIFAAGTIATLLAERSIAARFGRRGAMLGGVATMMVAAGLLAAWKALPGLLIGRLLTGVGIGLAAGVAIPYLIELRLRADPKASPIPARNIGAAVNVGALGVGPLVAGFMAQWAPQPLVLPYIVIIVLGAVALIGLAGAPETGVPAPRAAAQGRPPAPAGRARLPVPAAAGTIAAFAASGLFAALSGLILATTLHQTSHALSGATLFLVFTAGMAVQLGTNRLSAASGCARPGTPTPASTPDTTTSWTRRTARRPSRWRRWAARQAARHDPHGRRPDATASGLRGLPAWRSPGMSAQFSRVRRQGLEPRTRGLRVRCSAN